MSKEPLRLSKLPPEVEAQLPEQVQQIRKFYFSLSEEDRKKLEDTEEARQEKAKPAAVKKTESTEALKRLLTALERLAENVNKEDQQESITPAEKRQRILESLSQKINIAIDEAKKEMDQIN